MDTRYLSILFSFILGASVTILFISFFATSNVPVAMLNPRSSLANVVSAVASSDLASSTTTTLSTTTLSTATASSSVLIKHEFKLLRDVDQCLLNKLGAQGWQPIQFGGNVESAFGFDENCKNPKVYDTLDWVLLSRDKQ